MTARCRFRRAGERPVSSPGSGAGCGRRDGADIALRGASPCAHWTKGRAQNDANYEKTWLTGYFSGMSIALDINFWGNKGSDELETETAWKWIDGYCAANTQNSLVQAAEKLFVERANILQTQARPQSSPRVR